MPPTSRTCSQKENLSFLQVMRRDASCCMPGTSFIRPVHVIQYPWFFCLKPTAGVLSYVLISWSNQDPGRFTEGHSCWSDSLSKLWIHTCRLFSPQSGRNPSTALSTYREYDWDANHEQELSQQPPGDFTVIPALQLGPIWSISVCPICSTSYNSSAFCLRSWTEQSRSKRWMQRLALQENHFRHFKQEPSFIDGWSQHPVKNT